MRAIHGYTPNWDEYQREAPRHEKQKGVLLQRTKSIRAGEYLEAEIYPVIDWAYARQGKRGRTTEQMRRANTWIARKKLGRLMNANFGKGDYLLHLTMANPCGGEEFQKAVNNFMRKLRRRMRKAGQELKYIYVIEYTGQGENTRYHLHMVMNGGVLSRDEVEALWPHGLARADRCQPQDKGLSGFAMYITQRKTTQEKLLKRRWACSRGLKQPKETISDTKFSRGACMRLYQAATEDYKTLFEKKYPGYELVEPPMVRFGEFLPGVYVHAFMRKKQASF